jgi:hypothetical protein
VWRVESDRLSFAWRWLQLQFLIQNMCQTCSTHVIRGPSWSYGSWIYYYIYNQCLSPQKLWVRIPLMAMSTRYVTTLCCKVCRRLSAGRWFSPNTLVSSTNNTGRHDITEILMKVALSTIAILPHIIIHFEADWEGKNQWFSLINSRRESS